MPSVDRIIGRPAQTALSERVARALVVSAVREVLDERRRALLTAQDDDVDGLLDPDALDRRIAAVLDARLAPSLVPVLNATGVSIHTNLGRAPLGRRALDAIQAVAGGYSNLEYDLEAGARGSRHSHVASLFQDLTGAEAAMVVNNNAGAVLLILTALGRGREVVVSRGELIEIGGSFRLPDIMEVGGATLREVGTTNRTRAADYERAVGEDTALILQAHRSNFAIVGFTESPRLEELVAIGREHEIPVVVDLGSGTLVDEPIPGVADRVWVGAPVEAGADLVCFSGDKLLGGPQCGVIVGRRDLIDRLRHHPMTRALRIGKLTIAALEATVRAWLDGSHRTELPIARLLATDETTLADRAERLAESIDAAGIAGIETSIERGSSRVGGGTLPEVTLPTWLVGIRSREHSEAALEAALRAGSPPVISRVADGRVLWDVRTLGEDTLGEEAFPTLVDCLAHAVESLEQT